MTNFGKCMFKSYLTENVIGRGTCLAISGTNVCVYAMARVDISPYTVYLSKVLVHDQQ